ncbi:MAG: hypothetical protein RLZZ111_1892 [Planctomycetota bacterium]
MRPMGNDRLGLWAGMLGVISLAGAGCETSAPAPAPKPAAAPIQTRETIRKTTQNVLPLEQALAEGGVRADMSIQGQGLEVAADAYRTSVGKLSVMAVDHKMKLFEAENNRKPKDHAEFMERIIEKGKPDGIALPMLPYYQEYAYDPEAKALVVIEFPAKKEQRQRETTGAAGL